MSDQNDGVPPGHGRLSAKYTMAITVKITGVPAHRIRRFEEFGLCQPARSERRQRLFSDSDIEVIRQISELEKDGVNLAGVRLILMLKKVDRDFTHYVGRRVK
jgi:MerR family transcriptional regulator, glutamine synthetase repressor